MAGPLIHCEGWVARTAARKPEKSRRADSTETGSWISHGQSLANASVWENTDGEWQSTQYVALIYALNAAAILVLAQCANCYRVLPDFRVSPNDKALSRTKF